LYVEILIDGNFAGNASYFDEAAEQKHVTKPLYTESGLVDNGAVQPHTMTATIEDNCGENGGSEERHFTVEAVNVDVLGAH
jgi:hypothetical protein